MNTVPDEKYNDNFFFEKTEEETHLENTTQEQITQLLAIQDIRHRINELIQNGINNETDITKLNNIIDDGENIGMHSGWIMRGDIVFKKAEILDFLINEVNKHLHQCIDYLGNDVSTLEDNGSSTWYQSQIKRTFIYV